MKKIGTIKLLLMVIISFCLFDTCKKHEATYDVFPLKAGNEFYYKYNKSRFTGIYAYTTGTETWKVISESKAGSIITYTIERKLNATLKVAGQTIIISDSIRSFKITEDEKSSLISTSSMMLYHNINFKRYQENPQLEIKQESHSNTEGWSYLFKTDSGLIKFTYYHPPNQITNEILTLDSISIFR